MQGMVRLDETQLQDDLHAFLARICPLPEPGEDLVRWLWLMTPAGAPTIPVLESTDRDDGPGHVPLLTSPRSPGSALHEVRRALPEGLPREPGHRKPRRGADRWRIEAAHAHDLRGQSEVEVGASLDLFDSSGEAVGRCRRAGDYVRAGRELLAEFGAWPWALAPNGKLERRWWTMERYALALLVWHQDACVHAIEDALRASGGLIATPEWRGANWGDARRIYRERLSAMLDATIRVA
jgi:hypothetical protein